MTRQIRSELASLGQHCTQLAIETLHQLLSLPHEFSITAAAVAEIADGDAIDETRDADRAWRRRRRFSRGLKVRLNVMNGHDSTPPRRSAASRSHACNSFGAC